MASPSKGSRSFLELEGETLLLRRMNMNDERVPRHNVFSRRFVKLPLSRPLALRPLSALVSRRISPVLCALPLSISSSEEAVNCSHSAKQKKYCSWRTQPGRRPLPTASLGLQFRSCFFGGSPK